MGRMSDALDLVTRFVELTQHARATQTSAAWEAVAALWADDVEIRVADRRGGEVWRVTARGRAEAVERLSRPQVAASRLRTTTTRAFASAEGDLVVVEQLSEHPGEDGVVDAVPVCHVFEVSGNHIQRQSVYRNEA
jgi:ketosteroid isomerase-like protein